MGRRRVKTGKQKGGEKGEEGKTCEESGEGWEGYMRGGKERGRKK